MFVLKKLVKTPLATEDWSRMLGGVLQLRCRRLEFISGGFSRIVPIIPNCVHLRHVLKYFGQVAPRVQILALERDIPNSCLDNIFRSGVQSGCATPCWSLVLVS